MPTTTPIDWYDRRDDLEQRMMFRCASGAVVRLDRPVPGDAACWYVASWHNGWFYDDATIHPADLAEELSEPPQVAS